MLRLRNLRVRISIAFFVVSLTLGTLFAAATFLSFELIRPWYSEIRFADDLDRAVASHAHPGIWRSDGLSIYIVERANTASLPAPLRLLEEGSHLLDSAAGPREIRIEDRGDLRYVAEYHIAQIEQVEAEITRLLIALLAGGVLLSSLLALGIGFWRSSHIVLPLTRLARRVESLGPETSHELPRGAYGTDEVADLARAFEEHVRRLGRFVQREKDFAAHASHELRTGVASISSGVELLMTEGHGEPTRSRLARLQRASRHMSRLIEALLVLAREGRAAHDVAAIRCRLSVALREIVDSRLLAAKECGIELSFVVVEEGEALVPEEGLSIVVGNLIDNAIAYAPEGPIRVQVTGHQVEITDSGPGIPEHELPYVFQRSFRGQASAGRGAGLGLAIVRKLCEHYGWSVEIVSSPDSGTTARVGLAPALLRPEAR